MLKMLSYQSNFPAFITVFGHVLDGAVSYTIQSSQTISATVYNGYVESRHQRFTPKRRTFFGNDFSHV